jgi:hypothetical protein
MWYDHAIRQQHNIIVTNIFANPKRHAVVFAIVKYNVITL